MSRAKKPEYPVEMRPIGSVSPYPGNPRRNEAAIAGVVDSIRRFGFRQPIVVDAAGVVVVGHTRLQAAVKLGLAEVPVHVAEDLSPRQARAYRIADNKSAEASGWDDDLLLAELLGLRAEGEDLAATGFNAEEIADLLGEPSSLKPGADLDDAPALSLEHDVRPGDLYRLGRHRLLCADATREVSWQRLLGEERVAAVLTDPPYGVSYVGGTAKKLTIQNDDLSGEQLEELLRDSLGLALKFSERGAAWYVFAPSGPLFLHFAVVGTELGWWRQSLVWVKDQFVLGRSDYHARNEVALTGDLEGDQDDEGDSIGYGWAPGGRRVWKGGRTRDTVWFCERPRRNADHPTMKPTALFERALRHSTVGGALVVDPFAGSGTTMIACEASGRSARLIELDPKYCDAILRRWKATTGLEAELVDRIE